MAPATSKGSGEADLVLRGAPVYTVDASRSWARAVAITDGRIAAVGTEGEIDELVGARTRVLDLGGSMVLPAFQDAHAHPLHGGVAQSQCDLHDASGREEYGRIISAYASKYPDKPWIEGSGWSMADFPGGTPHRDELDALVGDRPAFLINRDGHGAWVNTRTLEMAGITAETSDPFDGRIERDADGRPSGTLHEGAMGLVERLIPEWAAEALVEGLRVAQRRMHSLGISAWNDAWVTPPELRAYQTFAQSGEMTARVVLSLLWARGRDDEEQLAELKEQREQGTLGRMRASNAKIFQDGVAENYTAALIDPYLDASGTATSNSGLSMVEPEALCRQVTMLDGEGFQVHIHAIGDRAVREALDAFEAARDRNGARDSRHHIAHIQVIHPDDIGRFRDLGVIANAQPFWASFDPQMTDLTIPFLGPERSELQYPFGSLRAAGATIAFGSDWPVSTPDPLLQIEVAVTRRSPDDDEMPAFLPHQCLDLATCLDAFTMGSAYVNRLERETGSIEAGKLADIVVLDRNLFSGEPGGIGDAKVALTLVEGEPVYADPALVAWD